MTALLSRIARTFAKSLMALASIFILLCLILFISLQGVVVWLNTPPGGKWLSGQIETAMAESPYKLDLKGFALSGLFTIRAAEIHVQDKEGAFLSAHHARLKVNPFPVALKKLSLRLSADHIQVTRPPLSEETKKEEKTEPQLLALPNIYFQQIDLGIFIRHLELGDEIVKGGLSTKLNIAQNLSIENQIIKNHGQINLENLGEPFSYAFPLIIEHQNQLNFENQTILLEHLSARIKENNLKAEGQYNLSEQHFNIAATALWKDLNQIHKEITKPIDLKLNIDGLIEDFSGHVSIESAYKNIPAAFQMDIQRQGDVITLPKLDGTAQDVFLSGNLSYNLLDSLAEGDLNGSFGSFDLLGILAGINDLSGKGKFSAKIGHTNQVQHVQGQVNMQNLSYDGITAGQVTAEANLPDIKNWKTVHGVLTVQNANLPQTHLKTAKVTLAPADQGINITLNGNAHSLRPYAVSGEAHVLEFNPPELELKKLVVTAGKGRATLQGTLSENIPNFTLATSNLNLSALPYVDLGDLPLRLQKLDGTLSGTMAKPDIQLDYAIDTALENIPKTTLKGLISYQSDTATVTFDGQGKGIESLNGKTSLPLQLSLQPFAFELEENAALDGQADGAFNLSALAPLFLGDGYDLRGQINMNMQIGGGLSQPDLNGSLRLVDGYLRDEFNDIELTDILAQADFNGQKIALSNLQAKDAARTGTLKGHGQFDLSDPKNPQIDADLDMANMNLLKGDSYDARLNADINFLTKGRDYYLSGLITPQEIQINLPERFEQAIPSLNIVETENPDTPADNMLERLNLDMDFKAKNQIFVRGWGLDAELEGDLNINGTAADPLVTGQLQTIRGRYEELGRRFDVDRAILRFQGKVPPSPYLDVMTSTDLDEITAHILITGRAVEPKLTFSSTPSLPEDEVLSHILFGEDLSKISPYQAVQLAQTLRRFSGQGGGGIDLLGTVRDVTGLDDIRVEGVGTENAKVGAGKYITDKVYLELEQGTGENSGAASVEIEVTPSVKVESKAGQNGDSEVGVFWEWDY